ncbi:30S ribosomal protein S5 [Patescibacteria group bacterium]|nr:MAG: 30S ribosomal protein S5 [Patescibacteria group bacterium]
MENNTKTANTTAHQKREGGRGGRGDGQNDRRRPGRGRGKREERAPREFEQKILDLARVTRVTAGGKRMSFRCALVIGDKKGRVGFGVAKGGDVQIAIEKAYKQAKKHVLTVPLLHDTIPHPVWVKYGSALILLKPAPKGTGLKSGGAVRMILEFGGVPNAVSKIVNSSNKINIAKATLEALKQLRVREEEVSPNA